MAVYDAQRPVVSHEWACNAPVNNIYFSASGRAAPCWRELHASPEVWGPDRSIMDLWRGEYFQGYRDALRRSRFVGPCTGCGHEIDMGVAPLAAVYDRNEPTPDAPSSFELELSNQCNFACTMCDGDLSSKIRREREHRPPLVSPYDDDFVDQLTELLPTTRDIRFSGGEPTMHPIVHTIADRIAELRPDLPINISTNGSLLNSRVRALLDRTEVRLFLSFDSLQAERYHAIRVGSDFDVLMDNIEAFREHFASNRGSLSINTNPMRPNWDEMATFVRWCSERNLDLAFNTVVHPDHLTLATLPPDELRAVHRSLAAERFELADGADPATLARNVAAYEGVVAQVLTWSKEALVPELEAEGA